MPCTSMKPDRAHLACMPSVVSDVPMFRMGVHMTGSTLDMMSQDATQQPAEI